MILRKIFFDIKILNYYNIHKWQYNLYQLRILYLNNINFKSILFIFINLLYIRY
jgi:hypothetical protein